MSITGLLIATVLLLIVLVSIVAPFLMNRNDGQAAFINRQRERALTYYERVLSNIRDLDEDHSTGKIMEEEYNIERGLWVDRGVKVLKLLDDLTEQHNIIENQEADDATIDAAIEAAIIRKRQPQEAS